MTRVGLCYACQPSDIFPEHEPPHCYGKGDRPGISGLISSGFFCSCDCRKEHSLDGSGGTDG